MKVSYRILCSIMMVVVCFLIFPIYSLAETSGNTDSVEVFISNPVGNSDINIESLIDDKVNEKVVDERYNMFSVEKPEKYTFDKSVYLIEYNVSKEYWNNVTTMDYKGLTEKIDYSYPTIYIPLFGNVADTEGNVLNRVIGHIKLSYNWSDKDYKLGMSLYNLADNDYKNKKYVWFYEEISEYISQNNSTAQQVIMLRYPSSLSDGHEKIAVIQTKDNTVILDVSNSLNIMTGGKRTSRALAYTVSEYSIRRKEIEKNIYQAAEGWDKNPAGGYSELKPDESLDDIVIWFPFFIIVSVVASAVIFLLIRKHHKYLSKTKH